VLGRVRSLRRPPRHRPGITNARHLALNARHHLCASQADGQVRCWTETGEAAVVAGLTDVTRVAVGERFGCAIRADRTLWCWGENTSGQLGDNTTTLRTSPVSVVGLGGVATAVSAGDGFSCALLDGGAVKCWGGNNRGQLGDTTTTQRNTPVAVSGLAGVAEVAAGAAHTCARLTSGRVRCWGGTLLRAAPRRAGALLGRERERRARRGQRRLLARGGHRGGALDAREPRAADGGHLALVPPRVDLRGAPRER